MEEGWESCKIFVPLFIAFFSIPDLNLILFHIPYVLFPNSTGTQTHNLEFLTHMQYSGTVHARVITTHFL